MKESYFFKKVESEFEGHPYKERLMRELQDHLEDFEADELVDKKDKSLVSIFEEPHQFKKTFVSVVDPWRRLVFVSEVLSMGVALGIIGIMFGITLGLNLEGVFSEGSILNAAALGQLDFRFMGYMIMIGVMWFFGYRFAFNLFAESRPFVEFKESTWFWMLISPIAFFFAVYAFSKRPEAYSMQHFFTLSLWLLVHIFVFCLAYRDYKKSKITTQVVKKWGFFFGPNVLLFTLLIFFDSQLELQLNFLVIFSIFLPMNLLLTSVYFLFKKRGRFN